MIDETISNIKDLRENIETEFCDRSEVSDIPEDLSASFVSCDTDVYPNILVLLKIGCTLPVSSCETERSFSGYRRVNSFIRSSMTTERLAGLTLMHLHNDIEIDLT